MNHKPSINNRLMEIRVAKGLSQKQFASLLECSQALISGTEQGKILISDNHIRNVVEKTGASRMWITTGEGEMFSIGAPKMEDEKPNEAASVQLLRNIFRSGNEVYIKAIVSNLSAFNEAIMATVRAANYQPPEGMVLIKNRRMKDDPNWKPEDERRGREPKAQGG